MSDVTYKIRVNRPCRLFIDDEEVMILEESKLTKINLPEGEYLRKVVALDNSAIFDEVVIVLSGAAKMDLITLSTNDLDDDAKRNALPDEKFKVGDLYFEPWYDRLSIVVTGNKDGKYIFENINIPEQVVYGGYTYPVTSIGFRAFAGCSSLTSITIPNSVKSIGQSAFAGCTSLTSPVYNAHCFAYMPTSYFGAYTIPEGIKQIAGDAFYKCLALTSVTIPNSVTSIGYAAFAHCSSLTSFTIPNSVTSIGWYAFDGCKSLTSINIPNSVTSIGQETFRDCKSLTSITIPNSVTSIEEGAFLRCTSLTSITIPKSVKSIGHEAFRDCKSLTSITIPKSVKSIGQYVFLGCESLIVLNYDGTKEEWKKIEKNEEWYENSKIQVIRCTDGEIRL